MLRRSPFASLIRVKCVRKFVGNGAAAAAAAVAGYLISDLLSREFPPYTYTSPSEKKKKKTPSAGRRDYSRSVGR